MYVCMCVRTVRTVCNVCIVCVCINVMLCNVMFGLARIEKRRGPRLSQLCRDQVAGAGTSGSMAPLSTRRQGTSESGLSVKAAASLQRTRCSVR